MLGPASADWYWATSHPEDILQQNNEAKAEAAEEQRAVLYYMRLKIRRYGGIAFLEAIRLNWNRKATDPRDKVFALLGIVSNCQGLRKVDADYTLNEHEVFAKATFEILRRQRSLKFLTTAVWSCDENEDRPSWVPRFTHQRWITPRNEPKVDYYPICVSLKSISCRWKHGTWMWSSVAVPGGDEFGDGQTEIESLTGLVFLPELAVLFGRLQRSAAYGHRPELQHVHAWHGSRQARFWTHLAKVLRIDGLTDDEAWQEFSTIICQYEQPGNDHAFLSVLHPWFCYSKLLWDSLTYGVPGLSTPSDDKDKDPPMEIHQRHLFRTAQDRMGIAPVKVQPGDEVWDLGGGGVVFLLRPAGMRKVKYTPNYGKRVRTHRLVANCMAFERIDDEKITEKDEGVSGMRRLLRTASKSSMT